VITVFFYLRIFGNDFFVWSLFCWHHFDVALSVLVGCDMEIFLMFDSITGCIVVDVACRCRAADRPSFSSGALIFRGTFLMLYRAGTTIETHFSRR
jgi:hypothetical protein